ncbi:ferritin-like domain-containing protein [Sneathiella marina]|uniref:Ferritin-like domain-containing protein n=1 Tax=Sneathiella marina TaxID=2950108 RepID=A0ABY4W270_9PROT|nr:ferritin-like domain-containing protein [Sneathiella marina]USG59972.1 ferritin-like domain-containing protein [Sneathiella marina]
MLSIAELADGVLQAVEGADKATKSREAAEAWRNSNGVMPVGKGSPPDRPSRPSKPDLLPPNEMPRRRGQSDDAKAALLHAVLHIELNAIDLAWDMIARFTHLGLPRQFYDDWVKVGDEEAKHFTLLATRLRQLGYGYGDFPAHDGLWEAALSTKNDFAARLAIVPMVLEARGLDVTPAMITRFGKMGDTDSVDVLKIILKEEVGHVAIGTRWFQYYCDSQNLNAEEFWQQMVRKFFKGLLKPPFNTDARSLAGLPPEYYLPLAKIDPIKATKKG